MLSPTNPTTLILADIHQFFAPHTNYQSSWVREGGPIPLGARKSHARIFRDVST